MDVFVPESVRPAHTVQDLVIEPTNGRVIALVVNARRGLIIVPQDILGIKQGVYIRNIDDVIEAEEVLRVTAVMKDYEPLIGKKVVVKSDGSGENEDGDDNGVVIGRINDFVIDGKGLFVKKFYTSKSVLGMFHFDNRIISADSIVEILPDRVIVKDNGKVSVGATSKKGNVRVAAAG